MTGKTCRLQVDVRYDDRLTDPDSLAAALDTLLGTALSTPRILDEYGNPEVGEFVPAAPAAPAGPTHLALVTGEDSATRLAAKLIAASAWFTVTPVPDGIFAVEVKREPAVVALVQQHLAAEAEGRESP